jgi:hypothetical protein
MAATGEVGVAGAGGAATMTDEVRGGSVANSATQRPQRARKPAGWVFAPALGAFFAALALLAFQVRAGEDPALGPAEPTAQAQAKPRRVLIRRVIKRVVVHHPPTSSASPSPAAVQTSQPTTTTPAPVPAAPEPAPAPAPLTTQSS